MQFTGKDLIEAGMVPGRWFANALKAANAALDDGASTAEAIEIARCHQPAPALPLRSLKDAPAFYVNLLVESDAETDNVDAVHRTMAEVMRTPVVQAGAIMPDACPAGPIGTIPVGGIVASTGIHPGMHSADICCSLSISVVDGVSPEDMLDAVHRVTHFGPGGREPDRYVGMDERLEQAVLSNSFTAPLVRIAHQHFGTQGDGNHFAFVGTLKSTGQTALVTHHGSRGFGAGVYKAGMRAAEEFRRALSPETLSVNAWMPGDSAQAEDYFAALQIVRDWTFSNHDWIHRAAIAAAASGEGEVVSHFGNEHNFVFRKNDGLFYHAKGATPAWRWWSDDASGLTLIPMNMAEPILIVEGLNASHALGFSPHGAGRNFSRTAHKRNMAERTDDEIFAEETSGIDARFYCGEIDISELPSAYKDADSVRRQIKHFGLAEIVDEVLPHGCIMAGDWEINAPWRRKKLA